MKTNQSTSDNKRYYWMKLQTDFFNQDIAKILRQQQNGSVYLLVLLKMCLKSIEREPVGVLMFTETIPHTPDTLSVVLDEDIEHIRATLAVCQKLGISSSDENGAVCIDMVHEMVGSITDAALRMRKMRGKRHKQLEYNRNIVTERASQCYEEEEIELDKDKEKATPPISSLDPFKRVAIDVRGVYRNKSGERMDCKEWEIAEDIKSFRYSTPDLVVPVFELFLEDWKHKHPKGLNSKEGTKIWRSFAKQEQNDSEWLRKYNRTPARRKELEALDRKDQEVAKRLETTSSELASKLGDQFELDEPEKVEPWKIPSQAFQYCPKCHKYIGKEEAGNLSRTCYQCGTMLHEKVQDFINDVLRSRSSREAPA